jgi:hypothetical protein
LALIGSTFIACNSIGSTFIASGSADGDDYDQVFNVTAANFGSTIDSIRGTPGNYLINLTGDALDYNGVQMRNADVNITVRGTGSNRITWKHQENRPPLFEVYAGKLILENINLGRSEGDSTAWTLLVIRNSGTIEMRQGVTLTENLPSPGVYLEGKGTFIMSGGIIENCSIGIYSAGDGDSITMSGGIVRNNSSLGIGLGGTNSTLTITGGTIINNGVNGGINVVGTKHTITMSGGEISGGAGDDGFNGIHMALTSNDCTVIIRGNAVIKGNNFGVRLRGANNSFDKQTGAIIYGNNAGANSNRSGAIHVLESVITKTSDMESNVVYAIKTNADGTGIVPGSQRPDTW